MREIKFRAWDVDEEEWYNNEKIPYQLIDNEGVFYWADDYEWNRYPGEVLIMQYTGLKDKNGVEIYEGDIVQGGILRMTSGVEMYNSRTTVHFKGGMFKCGQSSLNSFNDRTEVVGNIYQHPELLGDSQ